MVFGNLTSHEELEEHAASICEAVQKGDLDAVQRQTFNKIPPQALEMRVRSVRNTAYMTAIHYAIEDTTEDGLRIFRELVQYLNSRGKNLWMNLEGTAPITGTHALSHSFKPLSWACLLANERAVSIIVQQCKFTKQSINEPEFPEKRTPLMFACSSKIQDRRQQLDNIIFKLLENHASVHSQSSTGDTALHYYLQQPQTHMASFLIGKWTPVLPMDPKNEYGWTLLHTCAYYCASEEGAIIARGLIQKGTPIEFRDDQGMTALDLAKTYRNRHVAAVLRRCK